MGSVLNRQQVILDLLSHLCVLNMLIRLGKYEIKELFCFLVKWRSLSGDVNTEKNEMLKDESR